MKQAKNKAFKKLDKKVVKTPSLRELFQALPANEQEAVANFFNSHNIAAWIFVNLSDKAKDYINYCISLNASANNIETRHKNEE